ncbi:hypothetical protein TCDM_08655 [Trypanosoma cruzi Dm28c]|uniref:Uncharacterized protein n=1 Tax=Trypanosoma cruzi Dm28c TaxID=1416333 RepID=V5BBR6_TRYCR|nr:hypothetical protein TCDM_08655 [Trypanosoma cruzi Dm28c]
MKSNNNSQTEGVASITANLQNEPSDGHAEKKHHHPRKTAILPIMKLTLALKTASQTVIRQPMPQGHETKNKMKIKKPIQKKHQLKPQP